MCYVSAPPEGFSLKISPFSTMWIILDGWITNSTIRYIKQAESQCPNENNDTNTKDDKEMFN